MDKRYFSIPEANAHVPRLQEIFSRVMQVRGQLKTIYKRLEDKKFAPEDDEFTVSVPGAPPEVVRDRATFKALVEMLKDDLALVSATGCMIKDVETGLVDWLAKKDGDDILLCWRFGEREIAFWHDVESGFAGRRPISELAPELRAPAK